MSVLGKFQVIYEGIFYLPLNSNAKRMALESAIEYARDETNQPVYPLWPIVGITVDALSVLEENEWSTPKGIVRAHLTDRHARGRAMFDSEEPMPEAEQYFFDHDQVVLSTKAENARGAELGRTLELDPSRFPRYTFSIYLSSSVIAYLKSLYSDIA